ncbi:MAG: STAS domain-containing protein [SAR324 cluster bacterium]|nr:STAS domain-containing protein [SAR324 cluster bacterium]
MSIYIVDESRKIGSVKSFGSLDGKSLPEFSADVKSLIQQGIVNVIMDFQELQFISSAGIGHILACREDLLEVQGKLMIVCNNARLISGFKHARLDQLLLIVPSIDEAMNNLGL